MVDINLPTAAQSETQNAALLRMAQALETRNFGGTGEGGSGADGLSAYQIAVQDGFVGTETQWLTSLKGPKGDKGDKGDPGTGGTGGASTASDVSIIDAGGLLNATNVEAAIQELALMGSGPIGGGTPAGSTSWGDVNVADFKTDTNSWSNAFHNAFAHAMNMAYANNAMYPTLTGSQLGLVGAPKVIAPAGVYEIDSTIRVSFGVDFDFENCVLISTVPVKIATYDCFNMRDNAYKNHYGMPWFVGFRRGFLFSTANRDTSVIHITGGGALNCRGFIDDVSYLNSRSTMLDIGNFSCVLTDQSFRVHVDNSHIHDGWISSSGYNGSAIFSQSRLRLSNVICIPKPMQVTSAGDKACWIEQWTQSYPNDLVVPATGKIEDLEEGVSASKIGEVGHNNRGVVIDNCVFGGESGSMPTVRWYGRTTTKFNTSNALHSYINIRNSSVECGNTTYTHPRSPIAIHNDLPYDIQLEQIDGLSTAIEGLVYMMPSASNMHTVDDNSYRYSIYIGNAVHQQAVSPFSNDRTLDRYVFRPQRYAKDISNYLALYPKPQNDGVVL